MNDEKALEIIEKEGIAKSDELHTIEQDIRDWKRRQNMSILAIGEKLEYVFKKRLWLNQNYDSFSQWCADPNGVDIRPRTANLYRLLYRIWIKKLARLGVTRENIIEIDHCKLSYVANKLKQATDDQNILEIVEQARTKTLRELQDDHEAETFVVLRGKFTNRKTPLQEGNKQIVSWLVKWQPDISVDTFVNIFGSKVCEIKIWIPREKQDEGD